MPSFSNNSLTRLISCHPDLQKILMKAIKHYDITVICGYRRAHEQNQAYAEGKSQVQYPNSKHNSLPSRAVDVAPYHVDLRQLDWDDLEAFAIMSGYLMRISDELFEAGEIKHRLRWGGDWNGNRRTKDEKFRDYPHFELIQASE